jgi:diaminopimelate decarboxylase
MRALAVGADPKKIVFSGVGKTQDEIDLGLRRGILQFNVESVAELKMLEARAQALGKVADFALRVNPDVDPPTHPYMATGARYHKFGIPIEQAPDIYRRARRSRYLRITGVGCHIGSQITSIEPFIRAVQRLREIFLHLRAEGIGVRHLDLGGGLGIVYKDETPPLPREYARAVLAALGNLDCTLLLEPGRVIAANAGALITRVVLTKKTGRKNFVVVDGGMSDLMRPSLYGAYHGVQVVTRNRRGSWTADVVGPICETGDFLALDRKMPIVKADELLAIMCSGAYGFTLSSNYNSRTRAAEVMVRGRRVKIIRRRERFQDLVRGEALRPL